MLFLASLNSGSNGNCYYVGNDQEAVLVDAGISCRETVKRMERLGLPMDRVKAVFISHEHGDHIAGLEVLAKKYGLPVYSTPETLAGIRTTLGVDQLQFFSASRPQTIGNLTITAFPKFHDAADPHSFTISCNGVHVGIFTDIGRPCNALKEHFSRCHAAVLESNYDAQMLEKGRYPIHLKRRIRDGQGHLSNDQALEVFVAHRSGHLSHLLLGHLSANNNDPALVADLFGRYAGKTEVVIASRYRETAVYRIVAQDGHAAPIPLRAAAYAQASLF